MDILYSVLVLLGIGLLCAVLLTLASKYFGVKEDEKIEKIREVLPQVNCGACGFSGCDGYAKALSSGATTKANLCMPGGDGTAKEIAQILGIEAGEVVEKVAYVSCNGTNLPEEKKYEYQGINTCRAAKLLYSGDNYCTFACVGYGDCVKVCPRDAICLNEKGVASIDPRKCIGCGLCVSECPSGLIKLIRDTERVVVVCNNHYKGAAVRRFCNNGCIACGKCERSCPEGAIKVVDNLAVIDYDKCTGCGICKTVCPVGCIHEGNFICGAHFE